MTKYWERRLAVVTLSIEQGAFQLSFLTHLAYQAAGQGRNLNGMNANSPRGCTESVLRED